MLRQVIERGFSTLRVCMWNEGGVWKEGGGVIAALAHWREK
jgi:hypothetical protein